MKNDFVKHASGSLSLLMFWLHLKHVFVWKFMVFYSFRWCKMSTHSWWQNLLAWIYFIFIPASTSDNVAFRSVRLKLWLKSKKRYKSQKEYFNIKSFNRIKFPCVTSFVTKYLVYHFVLLCFFNNSKQRQLCFAGYVTKSHGERKQKVNTVYYDRDSQKEKE